MRYETVELDAPVETVREHIASIVSGIRTKAEGSTIDYYTESGVHVGTVSPVGGGDQQRSRLRYRSAFVRPHLAHARRKASEIRDAARSIH
jgi:hypothetical protein